MQYIAIIKAVLSLLPLIIEIVRTIESAFPTSGAGKAKLEAAKTMLQSGYDLASDKLVDFEKMWPALAATIGAIVSIANTTGEFNKK